MLIWHTLRPGKRASSSWQFTKPGEFYFACLVDDHFDMGMVGKNTVAAAKPSPQGGHTEHAPASGAAATGAQQGLGYIYDLQRRDHLKIGFGGLVSRYDLPDELKPVYGNPTSFMLFARIKLL
jgi:hypothetical protein